MNKKYYDLILPINCSVNLSRESRKRLMLQVENVRK